jgi:hypothetical protein
MAVTLPHGKQKFNTATGAPGVGYRLYTYIPGTTTPKATFRTYAGTTANTNPIIADSRGEMSVYWSGDYDVVLKDANNVLIWGPERLNDFSQIRDELANTTSVSSGDALIGVKLNAYGSVARTQHSKNSDVITPADFGATGIGADDTAALVAMFSAVPDGSVIDLCGKSYSVYFSVSGVTTGDAIALSSMLRLHGKTNITIRNGKIFVFNPGASGVLYRFPSTLAIDGCSNITLIDVKLHSKGENYGNSDASSGLGLESRRDFLAQNGGHALLITRSNGVKCIGCDFELCGSVGAFYASSSDEITLTNCYSSPQSLGYSAYAFDSWCGGISTSGFAKHEATLISCSTDNGGATYGSKNGITAEDVDIIVNVNGGVFKDSYANGSSPYIGAAFACVNARINVSGSVVDNCACIGLTYHSVNALAQLRVTGVVASNLRTSMHINANNSFGTSDVLYSGVTATYSASTQVWGSDELSQTTVVANQKNSSVFIMQLIDCNVIGAKYLSWNKRGCYGGIRIVGGFYEVEEQIFNSLGWGGAASASGRGFEVFGGTRFSITSTSATSVISSITNNDGTVATYLYVDIDKSVSISSAKYRSTETVVDTTGSSLTERKLLNATLIGCGSVNDRVQTPTYIKIVSLDGIISSNYRITVTYPTGVPVLGYTVDNVIAVRSILSYNTSPAIVGTTLQAQLNVLGTGNSWTVSGVYPVM